MMGQSFKWNNYVPYLFFKLSLKVFTSPLPMAATLSKKTWALSCTLIESFDHSLSHHLWRQANAITCIVLDHGKWKSNEWISELQL